jgi:hypothetical protein
VTGEPVCLEVALEFRDAVIGIAPLAVAAADVSGITVAGIA